MSTPGGESYYAESETVEGGGASAGGRLRAGGAVGRAQFERLTEAKTAPASSSAAVRPKGRGTTSGKGEVE